MDAAIGFVPKDAYALLMIVNHDIYESPEDQFCCGRAYGGSRVAVVSAARYHPLLDVSAGITRVHAWPASHCQDYMDKCCADAAPPPTKKRKVEKVKHSATATASGSAETPLHAALQAHTAFTANGDDDLYGLYLSRLCRTSAHELGHCFGLDHCVYYACCMQSTASLAEDVRQPLYM